ncbi:MAG: hypothetical protein SGJ21_06175 [Alphaproteobacteria bacterium]|nr:hypothetical protein [Alphaproteobacteria bacterium]
MSTPSDDQVRLWGIIITHGLVDEYERDWLGRVRSRHTQRYIRADFTPELAQFVLGAGATLQGVAGGAKAAITAAPDQLRKLLANLQEPKPRG